MGKLTKDTSGGSSRRYSEEIVQTQAAYTYETMEQDIFELQNRYPFINVGSAGQSVLGRKLYVIRLGEGPAEVFYNGAHHALEWITALLLMKFIEDYCFCYQEGIDFKGYNIDHLWKEKTIYILPMVNPDGIDLVLNGLSKENAYYAKLNEWNKGRDFSRVWQANLRGVDLNHNYDASWKLGKQAEPKHGIYGPGPTRYSGEYPESEPESKAVADFTRQHHFKMVLAFHSQGKEIYWNYLNKIPPRAKDIGLALSRVSGYRLSQTSGMTSYSGYKDWFIAAFNRPGYTIEVGIGKNPLPIAQFPSIYRDLKEMLFLAPELV